MFLFYIFVVYQSNIKVKKIECLLLEKFDFFILNALFIEGSCVRT